MKAAALTTTPINQDQAQWRQWRKQILAQQPQPIPGLRCTWQSEQGGIKHLTVPLNMPQMALGSSKSAQISFPELDILGLQLLFQYVAPSRLLMIHLSTMQTHELLDGEQINLGQSSLQFEFQSEVDAQVLSSEIWLPYLALREKELKQIVLASPPVALASLAAVPGQLWVEDEWCQLKLPRPQAEHPHWQQELAAPAQLANDYIDNANDRVIHFLNHDQTGMFGGEAQLKEHYYAHQLPQTELSTSTLSLSHFFGDTLMGHEQFFFAQESNLIALE